MPVKRYRKKPVVVEALRWTGANIPELVKFCPCVIFTQNHVPITPTFEGDMTVDVGDSVIKGVLGEYYPCKPDAFEKTYEEIS